jgi:DNA-binding transcriptional LysR family regulator
MGSLADSDLVSRKIGDIRFVLAASPDYISRNSVPADLEALGRHVFVRYAASGRPWPYILADGTRLPTSGRFVTDDTGSIREAVICGAGIAYLLHVTVAQDFAEGRLVELLSDLKLPTMPVFAVHAFGRQLPVRAKLFIDSLVERIAELSSS